MHLNRIDISYSEIPKMISLCLSISQCPFRCRGCHSPELQTLNNSDKQLTEILLISILEKYKGLVTTILFFGGEQFEEEFISYSKLIKSYGFKVALYTGSALVSNKVKDCLEWLKTGSYVEKLGGLDNKNTNQRLVNIPTGEQILPRV